jgi:DNA polymerase-1
LRGKGDQTDDRRKNFERYGWKCNEENLSTLPDTAPDSAKNLVEYLLVSSRLSTLEEWFKAYNKSTGRIHGTQGLGTWTHRNNHTHPNTGNITPSLRHLWTVPEEKILVGVDAASIQMRILAHYIEDDELIETLTNPEIDDHKINAEILEVERKLAKRWYYAWVLGAAIPKQAEILGCSLKEAGVKQKSFLQRFPKLAKFKKVEIPKIERKGFFLGFDGRMIPLGGYNVLSGILQANEKIIMSEALIQSLRRFKEEGLYHVDLVAWVHDEFQFEVFDTEGLPKKVAEIVCEELRKTTQTFNLKCPMDGSYWNDDEERETIGLTWKDTH